jgi:hypothetical protein
VVGWFPGPVEDTERLFERLRRLNRGLETKQWRVYERKEEPRGVRLVLSIDSVNGNAGEVEVAALRRYGSSSLLPSRRQTGGEVEEDLWNNGKYHYLLYTS